MSNNIFTGSKIWVVGKWVAHKWVGEKLFATFVEANEYAQHDWNHTVEHMYELAGDHVSPSAYWMKLGGNK